MPIWEIGLNLSLLVLLNKDSLSNIMNEWGFERHSQMAEKRRFGRVRQVDYEASILERTLSILTGLPIVPKKIQVTFVIFRRSVW